MDSLVIVLSVNIGGIIGAWVGMFYKLGKIQGCLDQINDRVRRLEITQNGGR